MSRDVVPLTSDPATNKAMRDALVEVLEQVDRGELMGLCIVTVDRADEVVTHRVAEKRLTLMGGIVMALIRSAVEK